MEQIRNTMMQHEALFKEQVQALHKLYSIQKSAMQERQKQIYSQAQFLAFSSEKLAFVDGQISGSVLEGKPLRPAYVPVAADKEESLALSLQPFSAMNGFKGCGSLWTDGRGLKTSHTAQSKPIRNFDLERLPEDYMDESEIQVVSKCSDMPGANSILSKRTLYKDENSFLGAKISFSQVDSPSSKQMQGESDLRILLVPRKEINQDCDGSSEGKVDSTNIKYATVLQNLNNTTHSTTSQDFPLKYTPGVGNFHACQDSSPSTLSHMDKQMSLHHQGLLVLMTKGLNPVESEKGHLERTTEQVTDSSVQVLKQLHQHPEGESMVATTHLKLGEQPNGYICGASFSKNPLIFSVGSSTLEPVPSETKDLENFLVQGSRSSETNSISGKQISHPFSLPSPPKSKDGGNANSNDLGTENSNGSGNGSNSVHSQESQDTKSCQDDKTSMHVKDTPGFGDGYSEAGHASQGRGEATESELEELLLAEDGAKPSFSSTISEIKHMVNCSNGDPKTITNSNEHLVTSIGEDLKDKSTLERVRENIAAEILLSFAPSGPHADHKRTQIEAESGRSSGGNMSSDKKWNLRERRCTNYSSNSGMNESMRWTKSVRRTRTSRKPR